MRKLLSQILITPTNYCRSASRITPADHDDGSYGAQDRCRADYAHDSGGVVLQHGERRAQHAGVSHTTKRQCTIIDEDLRRAIEQKMRGAKKVRRSSPYRSDRGIPYRAPFSPPTRRSE